MNLDLMSHDVLNIIASHINIKDLVNLRIAIPIFRTLPQLINEKLIRRLVKVVKGYRHMYLKDRVDYKKKNLFQHNSMSFQQYSMMVILDNQKFFVHLDHRSGPSFKKLINYIVSSGTDFSILHINTSDYINDKNLEIYEAPSWSFKYYYPKHTEPLKKSILYL